MSRDWKKDMETIKYLQSWRLDPGSVEDGAAFYTIEEDGIQTETKADNMLGEDAWLLNDTFLALEYWLQQAAELATEQEYAKQQAIMWNDKAVAEKKRADKAEKTSVEFCKDLFESEYQVSQLREQVIQSEAREQKLREAIEKARERFRWGNTAMALIEGSMILSEVVESLYPKEGETT